MNLVDFRQVNKGIRLLDLPAFDYIKVQFFGANPVGFYEGYRTLKPIFIQPLVNLNGIPHAYGSILRFDKNPSISRLPFLPLPLMGIDVSGSTPLHLYFYEADIVEL